MIDGTLVVPSRRSLSDHLAAPPHHPHGGHGGHHGGGRFYRPRDAYYIPFAPAYDSIEDEVAAIERKGDCALIRQQGGPDLIRRGAQDMLKGRGWYEKISVDDKTPGGSRKSVLLCPPAAYGPKVVKMEGFQPDCMVIRDLGRIHDLGDLPPEAGYTVRVQVLDVYGKPWTGIPLGVAFQSAPVEQTVTNGDGVSIWHHGTSDVTMPIDVFAYTPDGPLKGVFDPKTDTVLTIRSSVPAPKPLVTVVEGVLGGAGVAMTAIGYLADIAILRTFGELGIVAAVFARIGRG
jgi:hypothetical protein